MTGSFGNPPPGLPDEPRPPDAEAHPTEPPPDGSAFLHVPWPLVAGALLALLAIALAAGLYANRYLRPQPALVAAPPTANSLSAADTPLPATVAPTPAPAAATAPPQATPTSVPGVTAAITPLVVGTLAPPPTTGTTAPPAAPVTAVPTISVLPTVDPAIGDEVGAAYLAYWQIRSQAALQLDTSHLAEAMDGEYLEDFRNRIEQLRAEGRAINTQVSLNYTVVQATPTSAVVHDRIEDKSIYIDAVTKAPLEQPADGQLLIEFTLKRIDGVWKVVDSVTAP